MPDPLVLADAAEAVAALEEVARAEIHTLDEVVADAVGGKARAFQAYLRAYRSLEHRLLDLVRRRHPDLIYEQRGDVYVVDANGTASALPKELLDLAAAHAPFSPWVARFGHGRGIALHLLAEIRRSLPYLEPLKAESVEFPAWPIGKREFNVFVRRVLLAQIEEQPPLERIVQAFDLSDTELASLFGVRRQAVAPWLDGDVPAARAARIQAVAAIAELLERNLNTHAIPGVVRRAAEVYGGRSILAMIQQGREDDVLLQLQRTFDWAATA